MHIYSANSLKQFISLHSDTLSWFPANQFLLLLLNAACLAQKQQIKYQFYGLWFNLQTVEDGDLESAIQMTEVVEATNSMNSE